MFHVHSFGRRSVKNLERLSDMWIKDKSVEDFNNSIFKKWKKWRWREAAHCDIHDR